MGVFPEKTHLIKGVSFDSIMEEVRDFSKPAPATQRQLAAIMFADMMGYTAMMQEDEQKAKLHRDRMAEVLLHYIPLHSGRIIQNYGDGTLSIFSSSSEGVKCATKIQLALQQEPKVLVRIGLHSGDVFFDEHNIYGDCVNLTSRIESLSVPGGVLISDRLHDEIKNQKDIETVSLGRFSLKNVKRQVEIFAVSNEGLVVPTPMQVGVKAGSTKSIAVMPFINMSADPENEYFSDGIAEEILNALTKVDGLQVCSRSSSFTFKGKNKDVRQIGNELGVATVLEGSVRRAGQKVRISAQLTNTLDGYQVWSEVYDGDLDDIFKVQDEISLKIVNRLRANFSQQGNEPSIVKLHTDNVEAYNLYLKGRFHWNKSNPEDIHKAIQALEASIKLDPSFAQPYCLLSFCYSFMGSSGLIPRAEAFSRAKDYTIKSIELDPQHAESHLGLAVIKFFQNWDFAGAEQSIQKAIALGLNSSLLNQVHGMILISKGRFEEAIDKITLALKQDPLSLPLMSNLADAYAFARRFDDAIAQYDKIIELDPTFRRAFEGKGYVYLAQKQYDNAIGNLEKYQSLVGHALKGLSGLAHAYAAAGYTDKALACLDKMEQRKLAEPNMNFDLDFAFAYTGFKDFDKAFYHLNQTYDQRMGIACTGILFCIRYPLINAELAQDIRFRDLVEKIGLEPM